MDANDRRERIAEEAAEWWVALQGEVTRAEREQYVDWLRESALHVAEMLRIAQVHGALKQFNRWLKIPIDSTGEDVQVVVPLPSSELPSSAPHAPKRTARRLAFALAAGIALAAIGLATFMAWKHGQSIETSRGERREVALADGSMVQVDPETRLRVEYQSTQRLVFLERGRALFHVARNKERPFLVLADGTTVRAVGTAFAVDKQSQSVVVTVAEGSVTVVSTALHASAEAAPSGVERATVSTEARSSHNAGGDAQAVPKAGNRGGPAPEILLTAGEQVVVDAAGSAEAVHQVDPSRALAWAGGRLVFEGESVEHVVEEFNRYNRVQVEVRDPELANRPISGTFSATDPESFIAFLEAVTAVRTTKDAEGNTIISPSR